MELVERYLPDYSMHILQKEILVICFEYLVETQILEYGGFRTYFNGVLEGEFLEISMSSRTTESGYYINNNKHGIVKQRLYDIFYRNLYYNNGDLFKITRNHELREIVEHYKKGKKYGFWKIYVANKCFIFNLYDTGKIIFTWTFDYWIKK